MGVAASGEPPPGAASPAAASPAAASPAGTRNPRWAVRLDRPGLPNLHQVSPTLYRGAQPTTEGLLELRRLGVKTVVSLRAFHGEHEAVTAAGLDYARIVFKVWHPEDEDIRRFLAIAQDPARQPVFVHCLRGADRTGTAIAAYRIRVENWTREDAIEEMTKGGFGFHAHFGNLLTYLRRTDLSSWGPLASEREPPL